jgi:Spy/CpxP family protein refolding chaperone
MKRSHLVTTLVFLTFAAAGASVRGDAPRAKRSRGLARLEECLSTLDLSSEQQASLPVVLSTGKAALRSSAAALKADRRRLRADIASDADKSVLGQDVLDQEASRKRLRADVRAVREQIAAKLTPEQLAALRACARPRAEGGRRGSSDTGI